MLMWLAISAIMIGGAAIGFKQGQENPDSVTLFDSQGKEFVDSQND